MMDQWALRGIIMSGLQCSLQRLGFILLRFHHYPAAEGIHTSKMRVINSDQTNAAPLRQKLIGEINTITTLSAKLGSVVVNLHCMGIRQGGRVLGRQGIPSRMWNGDKGASGDRTGS